MNFLFLAQTGSTVLRNSLHYITQIQEAWDERWYDTFQGGFAGGGSPYFFLVRGAAVIATLSAIYWLVLIANEIGRGFPWEIFVNRTILVLVTAYLLAGNGAALGDFIFGLHKLSRYWEVSILKLETNGVTIAEVLNDQLATSQAKDKLENLIKRCDALPAPSVAVPSPTRPTDLPLTDAQKQVYDKLECYERIASQAEELREEYTQKYCWGKCTGLVRFFSNLNAVTSEWIAELRAQANGEQPLDFGSIAISPLGDVLLTSTLNQILKWLMYALQKFFINFMEFGQWGAALSAPYVLGTALIPNRASNGIISWLILYFNLWMSKIWYVFFLGVYASNIATAQTQSLEDLTFAFIIGFFAPVAALGMSFGGALVMIRSVASTAAHLAASTISIGISTFLSYGALASRLRSK